MISSYDLFIIIHHTRLFHHEVLKFLSYAVGHQVVGQLMGRWEGSALIYILNTETDLYHVFVAFCI
jgi:hypothetical protein